MGGEKSCHDGFDQIIYSLISPGVTMLHVSVWLLSFLNMLVAVSLYLSVELSLRSASADNGKILESIHALFGCASRAIHVLFTDPAGVVHTVALLRSLTRNPVKAEKPTEELGNARTVNDDTNKKPVAENKRIPEVLTGVPTVRKSHKATHHYGCAWRSRPVQPQSQFYQAVIRKLWTHSLSRASWFHLARLSVMPDRRAARPGLCVTCE